MYMADNLSKEVRSYNMRQIKAKNTKPEILVRKFLFSKGYRYRIHDKKLPGKPDIVLPKYKIVILINGCFWHGHEGCGYYILPKTNTDWWVAKIEKNKLRDVENQTKLLNKGWNILTIFECDLKSSNRLETLNRIEQNLKNFIDIKSVRNI